MASNELEAIAHHYEDCWTIKGQLIAWNKGPAWELPAGFMILVFKPSAQRKMWTYATCGMSIQGDAPPLELHLFSPIETDSHVELLTVVAHYHLTGAYLGLGHTVNFGRPWLPESRCDRGLISLPYLDGPKLEWLENASKRIRFLWLVPITSDEAEFKNVHGVEALESRFEAEKFNYLDPLRKSVVKANQ